jgi:ribosomal protein S18 acetylase RimI-like enzyme
MRLVDTSVELGRVLPLLPTPPVPGVTVRAGSGPDVPRLQEIAAAFVGNRFHRDPRIPSDRAAGVYTSWVSSAVEGRHGQVLVGAAGDGLAGLATWHAPDDSLGVCVMALVAIHPDHRGRRVLDALVTGCASAAGAGARALVTSTQVSNGPALRAFGRHGLLPFGARHILHGWL